MLAYRRAGRYAAIYLAVILLVAGAFAWITQGGSGVLSVLAGCGLVVVFSMTTQFAAWRGAQGSPTDFVTWMALSWLAKMVVVIVGAVVLLQQSWVVPPLLGAVLVVGAIGIALIDAIVVARARIPYVEPAPKHSQDDVG